MGNVASDAEFIAQYRYLVREIPHHAPGRLTALHVKDLVYYQNASDDGSSGLRPFSDQCTQLHLEEGWTFHCRITIFRDPVLERAKTNARPAVEDLQKDASFCRVGMPEYLLVFRKWAKEGQEDLVRPVEHHADRVPLEAWRTGLAGLELPAQTVGPGRLRYTGHGRTERQAGPKPGRRKHLCLHASQHHAQGAGALEQQGRCGVFAVHGHRLEGVASLSMGRKFMGTELHPAYYRQTVKTLKNRPIKTNRPTCLSCWRLHDLHRHHLQPGRAECRDGCTRLHTETATAPARTKKPAT